LTMQKRPDLYKTFNLKKQFTGSTIMGSWKVWINFGNYLDFQGSRNNLHQHSYFEACLVLDGMGTLSHNGRDYPLKKGDLFITSPGIIHEIVSDKINSLRIQFVYFSFEKNSHEKEDETAILYDQYISAFIQNHKILNDGCGSLETLYYKLKKVSEESSLGKWFLQSENLARELILGIILKSTKCDFPMDESSTIDSRLQMALRFMQDNALRKLSVREIAEQACTSPRTLRRLMKNHCNTTVVQKNFLIRIEEAARYLIAHREKSVADIAYLFNFKNPSDFGRGFTKIMKISPGRFRENEGTSFHSS